MRAVYDCGRGVLGVYSRRGGNGRIRCGGACTGCHVAVLLGDSGLRRCVNGMRGRDEVGRRAWCEVGARQG